MSNKPKFRIVGYKIEPHGIATLEFGLHVVAGEYGRRQMDWFNPLIYLNGEIIRGHVGNITQSSMLAWIKEHADPQADVLFVSFMKSRLEEYKTWLEREMPSGTWDFSTEIIE